MMSASAETAVVPTELYLQRRPWFALYGLRLMKRLNEDAGGEGLKTQQNSPAMSVPKEVMHLIMKSCEPYTMGAVACVCRAWNEVVQNPELWKHACKEAWPSLGVTKLQDHAKRYYRGNWKQMWVLKPRLRYDGIYVSRNTYIKTGIVEWRVRNPVHLVCYYRYIRFFNDGQFLYKTTPTPVCKVARRMMRKPRGKVSTFGEEGIIQGRYYQHNETIYTSMTYPGSTVTEIRSKLRLRSIDPGRNDRLDIQSLMSYSRESQDYVPMLGTGDEDGDDARAHNRGLNTYVFVPWDQVESTVLNLSVQEMDYFCPG